MNLSEKCFTLHFSLLRLCSNPMLQRIVSCVHGICDSASCNLDSFQTIVASALGSAEAAVMLALRRRWRRLHYRLATFHRPRQG
jgi:hypothetical protein